MKNVFNKSDVGDFINRINNLTPETRPLWGKMSIEQMLAHCNVTYEMAFENIHPKPNAFFRLLLKLFVKSAVVSSKPYKKNGQTAPQFIIKSSKDFLEEKKRLINYITKTYTLGENHFEGKLSHSFGKLKKEEWNNMFSKHLDHHLKQFGV